MSQGDYIRHKISARTIGDLPSVISSRKYAELVRYQLANTIPNTKPSYQELAVEGTQNVFGMTMKVSSCPEFALCGDLSKRLNRTPGLGYVCSPHPARPIYVKQPANAKTECNYKENPCEYAISH